jgi:phenylacetate-CoA ligase
MLFNPEIERLPLPQLRALQNARLKEQVAYVYERVPFYQQKFDALGVHPSTFRGLEDLGKLGFTKKTDFRDNYPFGLFAVPENEVARLHCSSGTTGKAPECVWLRPLYGRPRYPLRRREAGANGHSGIGG